MYCNLYIVEGQSDVDKLTSLGCKYIYKLNGFEGMNKSKLEFLMEANKIRKAILVLDPDGPGKLITNILKKVLTNYAVIYIDKKDSIKHKKVGIAETNISILKSKLEKYIEYDNLINEIDLMSLEKVKAFNKDEIKFLYNYYHIDTTLGKNYICKQINILKLEQDQIKEKYNEFIR